ncbi:hypothetical protein A2U01_0050196, partial [Trifolium medium]|nr:hypothetical protein [Trifolium medium]
ITSTQRKESINSCLNDFGTKDMCSTEETPEVTFPTQTPIPEEEKSPSQQDEEHAWGHTPPLSPVINQTMDEPNAGDGGVEPDNSEKSNSEENLQNQPTQTVAHHQESSTQETSNDDDSMQEAEEGGSDILPVSSTSKLSA